MFVCPLVGVCEYTGLLCSVFAVWLLGAQEELEGCSYLSSPVQAAFLAISWQESSWPWEDAHSKARSQALRK